MNKNKNNVGGDDVDNDDDDDNDDDNDDNNDNNNRILRKRPVQRARKFSTVFGAREAKSSNSTRAGGASPRVT
jgi:hypothetical protein